MVRLELLMLTTDVFTELGSRRGVEVETWPQDIPEIEKKCNIIIDGLGWINKLLTEALT